MNSDNEFDKILAGRFTPPPSSNLAYRIAQHAKGSIYRKIDSLSFGEQVLRMFVIPKPAYATAFCLLLGLAIGFYNGGTDAVTEDWFLFLEMEEGDWL